MNQQNKQRGIFSILLPIIEVLVVLCCLAGLVLAIAKVANPTSTSPHDTESDSASADDIPTVTPVTEVMLGETADAGTAYIDSMIFFGESTTAHLSSRGVLSGGRDTKQVWADSSGTMMLSSRITSNSIVYPPTNENLTIAEACAKEKPAYLVLSFGLNGLSGFISNKDSYVNNYNKLIAAVRTASPDTKIILQTVYPVCKQGNFSDDVETLNRNIMTLNSWLPEIAAANQNVRVADTASVLRDSNNALLSSYDNGDGIHLTGSAYEQILYYLRTHAWQ